MLTRSAYVPQVCPKPCLRCSVQNAVVIDMAWKLAARDTWPKWTSKKLSDGLKPVCCWCESSRDHATKFRR
jgi:hypothetical protein